MAIPLTVLGGFLGAGKTTLLNHLLRASLNRRIAVLVNDFGAINIDAGLVAARDGDTISLANGCVCCSIAGGLLKTLLALQRRPEPPEHLIIEASGVADPWKIAQIGLAGRGYRLDGVIVLADAETVREQAADRYVGETVRRQLDAADLVVLNKIDRVSGEQLGVVRAWLHRQLPQARLLEAVQAQVPPALLLDPAFPARSGREATAAGQKHDALFQSWSFSTERPFQNEGLRALLDGLPAGLLRAKGVLWLAGGGERRALLQLVGRRWTLTPGEPWGAERPASRLVLIGLPGSFDAADLEQRFRQALI